jgi:hypothetical protein
MVCDSIAAVAEQQAFLVPLCGSSGDRRLLLKGRRGERILCGDSLGCLKDSDLNFNVDGVSERQKSSNVARRSAACR